MISISSELTDYCLQKLSFDQTTNEENYSCLPLCVIDSIFSIGVRYEGVRNVIKRVSSTFHIPTFLENKTILSQREEFSTSDFLERIENKTAEDLTNTIFNKQRTSSKNGILKVDAVLQFLKVLKNYNVELLKDVNEIADRKSFETSIKNITGQSSGISLKYFYMLTGNEDLIKPDRMILRFLKNATGKEVNQDEAQKLLFDTALEISKKLSRKITASQLDNIIWQYQRYLKLDNLTTCLP